MERPPGAVLVSARGVARRYGRRTALEPTDLDVHAGEVVVLVGPNGAGKSTLLAILAGALPPTSGAVETELPPAAVGWAPQRPAQYRRLSARENLVLFARLQREADPVAEAERLLADAGLPADGRPSVQLSVGNQQRLNLAIGFLGDPRVLLLDEPTASLDPEQTRRLWERVDAARRRGAGVVVATHLVEETARADRVLALLEGRVVFSGTAAGYRASEPPA
ncbi:MAG TPA: ABC transporter ATP-binding protein [Gaiellaceae bacterium]